MEMLPFCPGRVDAEDVGDVVIVERDYYSSPVVANRDNQRISGLDSYEFVSLFARLRPEAVARMGQCPSGDADVSNEFFVNLLDHTFGPRDDALDEPLDRKGYVFTEEDLALIADPEYNAIVQVFAENEEVFEHVFAKAWTKIMNADRYDGPDGNVCSRYYEKY